MGRRFRQRRQSHDPTGEAVSSADAPKATAPSSGRFDRCDWVIVCVIVAVAFALRLFYVWHMQQSPLFEHPVMDPKYHDEWAMAIVAGESYMEEPYFRAPLYPTFLAGIYKLVGHSYLAPRIVQSMLGALSCGWLFLIGRLAFGRLVGALAGAAAASYWILIYFDGELLIPSLIVFLDLALLWLLLRADRTRAKRMFLAAGVALGLSAIARPNIVLFAPVVILWVAYRNRHRPKQAAARLALLVLGAVVVVSPVTIRNYVVGHDFVPIASQGGVNFFIGNNPKADGHTAIVPGTPGGWWEGYRATIARAEQARGHSLKPSEVSDFYYEQAFAYLSRYPANFLELQWRKVRLFWSDWEISNNQGIYFWTERFSPLMRWLPLGFGLVGPLALLGLVQSVRRRPDLFILWSFVGVYMASVVLFFCTARYRVPVIPLLLLFAVYGTVEAIQTCRKRDWQQVLSGAAVLLVAALLVHWPIRGANFRNDAFSYVRLGAAYARLDDDEHATQSYRAALKLQPLFRTARFNLGKVAHRGGRMAEAAAEYRLALEAPPKLSIENQSMTRQIHYQLARVLQSLGETREASEHAQAAKRLDPKQRGH